MSWLLCGGVEIRWCRSSPFQPGRQRFHGIPDPALARIGNKKIAADKTECFLEDTFFTPVGKAAVGNIFFRGKNRQDF
jgi:hypothetical protein